MAASSPSKTPFSRHRHEAMATWFELQIAGEDRAYAAQAAHEVFTLFDRLEALLSRYREDSEIRQLGRLASGESMRLAPETAICLRQAAELSALTGGAFDPALGHLSAAPGVSARETTPRGRLLLDPEHPIAGAEGGPVHLDLGAIGKGFALDRAAELLREWDLPGALLIAGGSSLLALDPPAGASGWEIGLTERQGIRIANIALGASGASVKGAHILDPRDGRPAHGYARTWASAPNAAAADALSTAAMLLDREELASLCHRAPDTGFALLGDETRPEAVKIFGAFPLLGHLSADFRDR